jgi:transposase
MTSKSKVVFKDYTPNQIMLLPPSLEELIEESHPVRVVDQVIEQINIDRLVKSYKGGGTSSYHPRMLLKVMVYSYLRNIFSSRKIEEAVKQNIHFMWLAGMTTPDHNTINRFRGERLKKPLKKIFAQVVMLLAEEGLVSLETSYVDGTKIEANANRYSFVWGKAIKTNKEKMAKQLEDLWNYTQQIATEELKDTEPVTFEKIDAEKVKQTIEQIDEALKDKPISKKVKQKINYAKKNWKKNLEKYDEQEKILAGRNSYSKTDHDATFMRMKEDHMLNGQLKPGYNLQLSTNNQYITNYTLHHNPTDTLTLTTHLAAHKELYNRLPHTLVADAGYGSEENYRLLEQHNIEGYIKYNTFQKEQKKSDINNPFTVENLFYNSEQDTYYCPMGQEMKNICDTKRKTQNGFTQHYSVYQALRCEGCPLRSQCFKGTGNRTIQVNHRLNQYKAKAREKLNSPQGIAHRKQRCCDTEPVFANIKHNKHFKRFNLRSKPKTEVEIGLIALAHNLAKKAA